MSESEARVGSSPTSGLTFPRIRSVVLRDFSLFTRRREISLDFGNGVFCLAGANGLGKSTFVAALNFAITGRVPDPGRKFESVDEYYRYTRRFSADFFEGRIAEAQRESAEVELELSVGTTTYRLTRGMFEPDALRALTIDRNTEEAVDSEGTASPSDMHQQFAEDITRQVGLQTFEQLVFLQLFMLTFDERRNLIFWDRKVLERILFLAFGVDPAIADKADLLRREWEALDSRARNTQWQATQTRGKLKDVERYLADQSAPTDDLVAQYRRLSADRDELTGKVDRLQASLRDGRVRSADRTAQYIALQLEYEELFSRRASAQRSLVHHPIVAGSLRSNRCLLCETVGDEAISRLRDRVSAKTCPLCGSSVGERSDRPNDGIDELRDVDSQLAELKSEIDAGHSQVSRLEGELDSAIAALEVSETSIAEFEAANEALSGYADRTGGLEDLAHEFRGSIEKLLRRKDKALRQRKEVKEKLASHELSLSEGYRSAEVHFVPAFRGFAHAFLGLEFDVRLETRPSEIGLVLEMQNQERRLMHQVSESQRFFVDIALRMALAHSMSAGADGATMLIDTPEGSLDSAYESRAGEMFARFVGIGHRIIMTANINTSQLLLRLAERCGDSSMTLERMTEWTDLSEVQNEAEALFESAFSAIETSLRGPRD